MAAARANDAAKTVGRGDRRGGIVDAMLQDIGPRLPMPIRAVASQIVSVAKVCPQCGEQYEASVGFCPRDGTALASASDVNLVG